MCYRAEFGRSALKSVGEPPKLGSSDGTSLSWDGSLGGVADPNTHHSPTRVTTSNLVKAELKGVRINRRKPQNWEGMGHRHVQ